MDTCPELSIGAVGKFLSGLEKRTVEAGHFDG